jgi:hypothetical protein
MTKSKARMALLVGCGVAVVAIAGYFWVRSSRPKFREAQGIITFVDVTARRASIEIAHPKSGAAMEISGEVPTDCVITINDSAATLADLRVGDVAVIRGRAQREPARDGKKGGRRFTAESIRVTR